MASLIYSLCAITSLICAALLWRGYRLHGERLLLFTSACFSGLALNNLLVFADFVLAPGVDLSLWRNAAAAGSVLVFLLALVWFDRERS